MEIRQYEIDDYATLVSWWNSRKVLHTSPELLPRFGLICPGIVAGFLYRTDSGLAVIGGLISNPFSKKNERSQALDLLIEMLYHKAMADGFKLVTCSSDLPQVKKRFEKLGFIQCGENMFHFLRGEKCL